MNYQIGESVPICIYVAKNNGAPEGGQEIRCNIFDGQTEIQYLSSQLMTEIAPGRYTYNWSPGFTSIKTVIVIIYTGTDFFGSILDSYRIRVGQEISNLTNIIDSSDGRIA